jgi:hypothetical protein
MIKGISTRVGMLVLMILALAGSIPLVSPALAAPATRANATSTGPIRAVPLDFQRRAAQFIEDVRGSNLAPGWETARLGTRARPLYRPDLSGAAYYEFSVVALDPKTGLTVDAGYLILAAGGHDFPIAHWNYQGQSPTQRLEQRAAASGASGELKFYKLDSLAYAAEDSRGQMVATSTTKLTKVLGMTSSMLEQQDANAESIWTPNKQTASDDEIAGNTTAGGQLTTSGPTGSPLDLDTWGSWAELKSGYQASYGVLAEALRREASTDWQVEQMVAESGESLRKGTTRPLPLLAEQAQFQVSGSGAPYIQAKLVARTGLPSLYQITARTSAPDETLPFEVSIRYADGQAELLKFVIVPANTTQFSTPGPWTPWTTYEAGTDNDQRLYEQIESGTAPNTSDCYSGCGATAWSMLFGWADKQAALGNSYWAGRWGLYRQNGGTGADVVAPRYMDSGVRNMTWEIRNHVDTFCNPINDNGATSPWNMDDAWHYLDGRSGTRLEIHYNSLGLSQASLRNKAVAQLRDYGTPAIIGTGWLSHYPLAYRYTERSRSVWFCPNPSQPWLCHNNGEVQRMFYVNQGWGGDDNGWVGGSTWFAGAIFPN